MPLLLPGPLPVFARFILGVFQLTAFSLDDWSGHAAIEQLPRNSQSRTSWPRMLYAKKLIHQGS